jgi:hypothetical protein
MNAGNFAGIMRVVDVMGLAAASPRLPGEAEIVAKSTARAIGSGLGRQIIRDVPGYILGGGRRR